MDEKKLHSFLTIIKKGSINKAAEELGYTQSALSQMVQSMEQELDGKLVVRTPGGVTLTVPCLPTDLPVWFERED